MTMSGKSLCTACQDKDFCDRDRRLYGIPNYHMKECGGYKEKERGEMNSRNKGKRGELELVHVLQDHGFNARRGQQFSGANGDADVVGIDGLHIECKRVERLNIEEAMKQSERDARDGEIPCVMHRRNNEEWKVTVRLDDFVRMWHEFEVHHRGIQEVY